MSTSQDENHLQLLSVFHFVVAGICALFSLFPLLHVALGIAMVSGAMNEGRGDAPPEAIGWIFIVFPLFIILTGLTIAALIAVAGYRLSLRTNYTFCLVIAAIECLFMPFGTVLGVLTIIVLMKPSVQEMFGSP